MATPSTPTTPAPVPVAIPQAISVTGMFNENGSPLPLSGTTTNANSITVTGTAASGDIVMLLIWDGSTLESTTQTVAINGQWQTNFASAADAELRVEVLSFNPVSRSIISIEGPTINFDHTGPLLSVQARAPLAGAPDQLLSTEGEFYGSQLILETISEPGALIRVHAEGQEIGSARAGADGVALVDIRNIPMGHADYAVTAEDQTGNTSATVNLSYAVHPVMPYVTITSVTDGQLNPIPPAGSTTNVTDLIATGTATPGSLIGLCSTLGSEESLWTIAETTATESGEWSIKISTGWNFHYHLSAFAIEPVNHYIATAAGPSVDVDRLAPTLELSAQLVEGSASTNSFLWTGATESNALVHILSLAGDEVAVAQADEHGQVLFTMDLATAIGVDFTAYAQDAAGNASAYCGIAALPPVFVESVAPDIDAFMDDAVACFTQTYVPPSDQATPVTTIGVPADPELQT